MPVTRIKARPKKENKLSVELTKEDCGVLRVVLEEMIYEFNFLEQNYAKLIAILSKLEVM